ncbi:neocarzinostatin apoprotein domain-containing protein [Streptacidiphilus fuscans]|uniref:Uncharacterized protein n=1 Tax=Streptacidiphilus fuscans TaxID=2789292 RepID=A0A931FFW2_9ACTN|nr:neocarzinostatin apoprotein domain-containing protein [Streptacidiphilus fuscans]MBF9073277.1 hypothetical protein [Streptacidiphilus fuscans]
MTYRQLNWAERLVALLCVVLLGLWAVPAHADGSSSNPTATAVPAAAKPGVTITVTGSGWPASALLTVLLCGQDAVAGTDDCANATGRAVTTDAHGQFSQQLAVATPPKPCPCVIHVSAVMGNQQSVNTPFDVMGAPTAPIPPNAAGAGQLVMLSASLSGSNGLLNWFGSPPNRTLRMVVADMGGSPISNPEFQLGTWHSVLAPDWSAAPWQGTLEPDKPQEIDLPVQFDSGASGQYFVGLSYQGRTLTTQHLNLPVAWGVDVFWVLLFVVVAVGLFRIGLAVLDRVRPDVTQRARERRRAHLGRRRAGDPRPDEQSASGSPFVTPPAPRHVAAPRRVPVPAPMSAVPPSEVVNPNAETTVLPPILVPLPPSYAPTVSQAAPTSREATLPWFAPGTVVASEPQPAPEQPAPQQSAPVQPAPPQARTPGPTTPSGKDH